MTITASTLLALVSQDGDRDGPAFRRLAAGIAAAIGRGEVPGGSRLPAERALATASGMSRGAVVAAYDLLREDGLVLRRQGSGTWVRPSAAPDAVPPPEVAAAARAGRLAGRLLRDGDPDVIDLALSALAEPWGMDPAWFSVTPDELVRAGGRYGYLPLGLPALRQRLAELAEGRGVAVGVEGTAVTHGGLHGLALASRLLVHPGDVVAIESPTFPGAIDALARAGARFTTFRTDSGGPVPEELARVLAGGHVRAVYLMPGCHSATGSVVGGARRARIAELVDASGAWLIEDETLAPLRFAGPAAPPVSAAMQGGRRVLIGSLSKQVWAGLHVGWVHGSVELIERLGRLRVADDLGGSVAAQLAGLRALDGLEDRTASLRPELAARARHLRARLLRALPDWDVQEPDGGLSLWCSLPAPLADELASAAPAFGTAVLPGTSACVDGGGAAHVRVSYALVEQQLDPAVDRLAAAWAAVADGGNVGRRPG